MHLLGFIQRINQELPGQRILKTSTFGNYLLNIYNQISVKYIISHSLCLYVKEYQYLHFVYGMLRDTLRRESFGFHLTGTTAREKLMKPSREIMIIK